MDSFIVQFLGRVFGFMGWFSPLELLCRLFPRLRTHGWVDVWVLFNLGLAVGALIITSRSEGSLVVFALIVYGWIRILEVVVYQARVVLFDPFRQPRLTSDYAVRSYRRIVILALHNYSEVILWFASMYCYWRHWFGPGPNSLATAREAVYYSMLTMTTLGYGDIQPLIDNGRSIVTIQLMVAVFMTLIIVTRFVGYLPRPRTLDESEG